MNLWKKASKGGIVLLYVGLLLLLVSFISQIQVNNCSGGGSLSQGECRTGIRIGELWPFQELKLTATIEDGGVLTVYWLETDNVFSSSNKTNWTSDSTALQLFLKENPEKIMLEEQIEGGHYTKSYFSTRFMNAVVVFYNPVSEIAHLQYEGSVRFFGSTDETRNIAVCTTPLGVVLSVPWWTDQWKQRKNKLE